MAEPQQSQHQADLGMQLQADATAAATSTETAIATATAVTATGIRREGEYGVLAHMINQADLPQGLATYLHELLHRAMAHSNEEPQANSVTAIELSLIHI